MFHREKILGHVHEQMLSVYRDHGVIPKNEETNLNKTADDRSIYQLVEPGWLVVNRMKAWQGSVGISSHRGIISGHYICFRPRHLEHAGFLNWLFRSAPMTAHFAAISRGVRPGQIEIDNDALASTLVQVPDLDDQRRIADFLDDQVTRVDRIRESTRAQASAVEVWRVGKFVELVFPPDVGRVALRAIAEVRLGRQRSPERAEGPDMKPYLRSANVSDGRISLIDVLEMDFTPSEQGVFGLRPGDVLVTEGAGSPEAVGASAMWQGQLAEMYFQNTLIRLRARPGRALPAFLSWWARTSHLSGAMRSAASGANILHLGAEGVGRMPVPTFSLEEQGLIIDQAQAVDDQSASLSRAYLSRIRLLDEYKRSLITAAVTGELDVTTARSGVPV